MNPFFFGTGKRRLFGLYMPARAGTGRKRAVVICYPWGQEYIRAHRPLKQLAAMLTARGFHVLRFDYYGTGDSAGDMTDGDLGGWQDDIEMALEELQDTTDAQRVVLIGLRLGATWAAGVAARRRKLMDALVLWDPVVSGEEYLSELLTRNAAVPRMAASGGGFEVLGFPLTEALSNQIRALDLLATVPDLPQRTLVIASEPLASHAALDQALTARALDPLSIEDAGTRLPWLKGPEGSDGAVPVALLQRICQWLE